MVINLHQNLLLFSVYGFSLLFFSLSEVIAAEPRPADYPPSVLFRRTVTRITTVAFSEDELRRQLEKIFFQRPGRTALVSGFGKLPSRLGRSGSAEQNRQSAVMLWEGQFALSEASEIEFGISQPHLPWAIFLNGEYLAGWQSSKSNGQEQIFTPVRALAAGQHTLQLVAIRKLNEAPPSLCWRRNGAPEQGSELTDLLPLPAHGLVEAGPETSWQTPRSFHFLDTDQYLHCYTRIGQTEFLPATRADGLRLSSAGQSLSLPLLPSWRLAETITCRSRLSSRDHLLSARDALPLLHQLTWPAGLPEAWQESWQLRCWHYDRAGRMLSDQIIQRGFQENLSLALPLSPECGRLVVQAFLFSVPIAKPAQVWIIRPANFHPGLTVRGGSFWLQGALAVLRCDPLPQLGQLKPASATARQSIQPSRLYLFDDGSGDTHSEFESQSFEQLLQQKSRLNIGRVPLPAVAGRPAELRGLSSLGKLLSMRPDAALLNLGVLELQSGVSPEKWCRTLLFMSQVCLSANIQPILLTWPPQPGLGSSLARRSALFNKELGLVLGIPVIDLYSAHLQEDLAADGWFRNEFAEHLSPNATGQEWRADKIAAFLQNH